MFRRLDLFPSSGEERPLLSLDPYKELATYLQFRTMYKLEKPSDSGSQFRSVTSEGLNRGAIGAFDFIIPCSRKTTHMLNLCKI
jgi:hypothetical protein